MGMVLCKPPLECTLNNKSSIGVTPTDTMPITIVLVKHRSNLLTHHILTILLSRHTAHIKCIPQLTPCHLQLHFHRSRRLTYRIDKALPR